MAEAANLPWHPLYSVTRSGLPELTVYGIVYGWAEERAMFNNAGVTLVRAGDTRMPLWTRSVLKPWQLMVIYPVLKQAYPQLDSRHFALMMASHSGDAGQLALLRELMALGGFSETDLQCCACQPMSPANAQASPSPLYNPCSGKHLGYLLYGKARGLNTSQYLNPMWEPYRTLTTLLGYLLNRDPGDFAVTIDGCGMPNFPASAVEIAQLYHALIMPLSRDIIRQAPDEAETVLGHWEEIAPLMRAHPELVGGQGRLDTRLMQEWPVIAKEGADGLLALAVGRCESFADGAGFLVKLSSGWEPAQLETVIRSVLSAYGLGEAPRPGHELQALQLHFGLNPVKV